MGRIWEELREGYKKFKNHENGLSQNFKKWKSSRACRAEDILMEREVFMGLKGEMLCDLLRWLISCQPDKKLRAEIQTRFMNNRGCKAEIYSQEGEKI